MIGPKSFFDTNVLIYLLSSDELKADQAESLLTDGGTVSVQVLNEIATVCSRELKMNWGEIQELLTTIRRICAVESVTTEVHERALNIAERYGFSIYDSLIISAAIESKCETLYSEDLQHGQTIQELTITNPFNRSRPKPRP